MSAEDLQREINELVNVSPSPEADWIARFEAASVQAIAGTILHWRHGTGITMGPDPEASRREAAQAILQARLSELALNSAAQLRNTIDEYQRKSGRQTIVMLLLTVVIVGLTVAQIWIALRAAS